MADELAGLLKDISALLRKQTEQHEASTLRMTQFNEERENQRQQMADASKRQREDSDKKREEMEKTFAKTRELGDKQREEERKFKQLLLAVLDRQSRVLEAILARLEKA
jgi:hypothetical protein